eukprot:324523-Amphidinium_carterae.1
MYSLLVNVVSCSEVANSGRFPLKLFGFIINSAVHMAKMSNPDDFYPIRRIEQHNMARTLHCDYRAHYRSFVATMGRHS